MTEQEERLSRLAELGDEDAKALLIVWQRRRGHPSEPRVLRMYWAPEVSPDLLEFLRTFLGRQVQVMEQLTSQVAEQLTSQLLGPAGRLRDAMQSLFLEPHSLGSVLRDDSTLSEPPPRRYARQTVAWLRSREKGVRGRERGWLALSRKGHPRRRFRRRC